MSLFQTMNFGRQKKINGEQFVFSTYRINASAVYPAQIINSSAYFVDVGFDGSGIIDTSAITAHASGANANFSRLYDQYNKFGYLSIEQGTGSVNARPLATNSSFLGIDYLRDNTESTGLYKYGNFPLGMSKDFIVNYVFRNETQPNNGRLNFLIRTETNGHAGLLSVGMRPAGGNYIVGVKYIYANRNIQASDKTFLVPISNTNTTFTIFTFTYIQGVMKLYRNGTEILTTTDIEIVGGTNTNGIIVGLGNSDMVSFPSNASLYGGKINDFKTLSLYTGENLTSFNVGTYINTYKSIHGIT